MDDEYLDVLQDGAARAYWGFGEPEDGMPEEPEWPPVWSPVWPRPAAGEPAAPHQAVVLRFPTGERIL